MSQTIINTPVEMNYRLFIEYLKRNIVRGYRMKNKDIKLKAIDEFKSEFGIKNYPTIGSYKNIRRGRSATSIRNITACFENS
jgi:hypothetical protein